MLNKKTLKDRQKDYLIRYWQGQTRADFRKRFDCGKNYLNELILEIRKENPNSLPDKRYK